MQKEKYEKPYLKKLHEGSLNKFGSQSIRVFKEIGGVAVSKLISDYGSPLFILSEKQIRSNYRNALQAFNTSYPKVQFAWSYKTNYLNAVCNIFHQEGSWAEVVSGFEFQKALNLGVPGSQIIFNGPGKKEADLRLAVEHDALIHIDNFDEFFLLTDVCKSLNKKIKVAIRINLDSGIYPRWDKFGFNLENGEAWQVIVKIASSDYLQLTGLHCHIGTFVNQTAPYSKATTKLCELALRCKKELNNPIEYLDLGGGFASSNQLKGTINQGLDLTPTYNDYAEAITNTILNFGFKRDELPLLILETGRALIDDAGYLVGTVLANKRLSDGRPSMILDVGVNILFTSLWYDHPITPAVDCSSNTEATVVYGPLCMNIDVIREHVNLPMLKTGDPVVIHKVGAYNMTQWMQFITYRPAVVLITEKGDVELIRKAETMNEIEGPELLPTHLAIK